MFKKVLLLLSLPFGMLSAQTELPLIPYPQQITVSQGNLKIDAGTRIVAPKTFEAEYLQRQLDSQFGMKLQVAERQSEGTNDIVLQKDENLKADEYKLVSNAKGVTIKGRSAKEIFYGVQTLLQLIPAESKGSATVALVNITDSPKFGWRGMHLDVCRHFFPLEFIKKYIDFLAMYKMNTFHWHLTDDQGWRLEIKKYPRLTEFGAWRNRSMVGRYSDNRYEEGRYGGFYTQDEVREIVRYAAERHITVVPEIEMPGHASAAIAAYPELGCTAKQIEVVGKWGVFEDIFCPKEETFGFLEDVLTEVMAIFPSKIIHIGGDEAPKTQWEKSELAQSVIKREGLKNEHELQSYFIQRIEKFLNKHGREILGWDEILEGGLAPNAKVMSWRGFEGGIEAAKQKHDVVMTPVDYCYFDYYQGNPKTEPIAIGGYVPVKKVYSFNPVPKDLQDANKHFILGAQGNLWTEYITTTDQVEYMVFPRIAALTEVLWGTNKNYDEFQNRLIKHFKVLDKKGINYSKSIYEVTAESNLAKDRTAINYTLKGAGNGEIRYTTDGTEPTKNSAVYQSVIPVKKSTTIKAAYFENGAMKSSVISQEFFVSKSFGKKISLTKNPSEKYYEQGAETLVNGIRGDQNKFSKDWLGFNAGNDLEAVIDFETAISFSNLKINLVESTENWIYYPQSVEVFVSSNGKTYQSVGKVNVDEIKKQKGMLSLNLGKQKARFVKVLAKNHGLISGGNPGAGHNAWLFADEILVD